MIVLLINKFVQRGNEICCVFSLPISSIQIKRFLSFSNRLRVREVVSDICYTLSTLNNRFSEDEKILLLSWYKKKICSLTLLLYEALLDGRDETVEKKSDETVGKKYGETKELFPDCVFCLTFHALTKHIYKHIVALLLYFFTFRLYLCSISKIKKKLVLWDGTVWNVIRMEYIVEFHFLTLQYYYVPKKSTAKLCIVCEAIKKNYCISSNVLQKHFHIFFLVWFLLESVMVNIRKCSN